MLARHCLMCQMAYRDHTPLCKLCTQRLIPLQEACITCGEWTRFESCESCTINGTELHRLYVAWSYSEPLKTLIRHFKFQDHFYLSSYLAELMIANLPLLALKTECLIPIPLHPKKLKTRGFHQTLLLAKALSKRLKIPASTQYCQKVKDTPAQMALNRDERLFNLQEAFKCFPLPYQHITLIDDITTTGSTIKNIAHLFQQQGVTTIDAWAIAKA
jgi:ComF family protein